MTCEDVLKERVREFENCPRRDKHLRDRDEGRKNLAEFLRDYPFRTNPGAIEERFRTPDEFDQVGQFLNRLEFSLGALGKIRLWGPRARDAAADSIALFRQLLHTAVDDSKSRAEKIDAPWESLSGFGSDKHVAKKIVSSYYHDDAETLPIFKTESLVAEAGWLGIGLHDARETLEVGQKWQLLTAALLARKGHNETTRRNDNVYFMYVLEHRGNPHGP